MITTPGDGLVIGRLREEYFDLLPEIRRVNTQLEAEIRYHTLPIFHRLKHHEQLVVRARVKECESAINSLRKDAEGRTFNPDTPDVYSILNLPDLAGVRVLVFPRSVLKEVDTALRERFSDWTSKPVQYLRDRELAPKYYGFCKDSNLQRISPVQGEYQVVPMLLGLFWEVEHSAIYKPSPSLSGIAQSEEMKNLRAEVEKALAEFESKFEELIMDGVSRDAKGSESVIG